MFRSWECGCHTHVVPNWIAQNLTVFIMNSLRQFNPCGNVQKVLHSRGRILPTGNQGAPKTMVTTHPTMGTNRVDNYVKAKLCENWWYLQRAIERSLQAKDDPRPMHFIIASTFDKLIA